MVSVLHMFQLVLQQSLRIRVCDQKSTLPSLCHIQTWHTHRTSCTPGISEFHKGLNLGLHLVTLFNILNDGGVLVLGHARCLVLGLAHLDNQSFTDILNSLFGTDVKMMNWQILYICTFYGPRYRECFWWLWIWILQRAPPRTREGHTGAP